MEGIKACIAECTVIAEAFAKVKILNEETQ